MQFKEVSQKRPFPDSGPQVYVAPGAPGEQAGTFELGDEESLTEITLRFPDREAETWINHVPMNFMPFDDA